MKLVQMLAEAQPAELYDHAASVLTNVSRHPAGRRCFVDPSRGLVRAVLPSMTGSASETRRVGVAAALRNCCVDDAGRSALLAAPGAGGLRCRRRREGDRRRRVRQGRRERCHGGWSEAVRALLRPISAVKTAPERCDAVRQRARRRRWGSREATRVARRSGRATPRAFLRLGTAMRNIRRRWRRWRRRRRSSCCTGWSRRRCSEGRHPMRGGGGRRRAEVPKGEGEEEMEVVRGTTTAPYPGRGLKRWQWERRAREVREPEYQRKEIPAVEMSQKFYWTKCGLQRGCAVHQPCKLLSYDEDRRAFPWRRRLFRVVPRGRPRRADRTTTGKMSTKLGSDPAGGGGVHGHLKLNKGNFRCVSARSFMRFHNRVSQSPPRVILRILSTDTHPPNPAPAIPLFPDPRPTRILHTRPR